MDEAEFAETVEAAGGRAYIVGGWVRDALRGAVPHDKDYVVAGLSERAFRSLFKGAVPVGGGFPVFRLNIGETWCDVALARRDSKTGRGYRGFSASYDERTTIEEDLRRRDTTINSIACDIRAGNLVDPFGGALDIGMKIIRATSEHFTDDPVRALRAARQAALFGYSIEPGTLRMMGAARGEIAGEPSERIAGELKRAMCANRPSVFFERLQDAGLLDVTYPQLHALPSGVFERAMQTLDGVSAMTGLLEVRFAALICCLGAEALGGWKRAMALPRNWIKCASFAASNIRVSDSSPPDEIAGLLQRVRRHPLGADGLSMIILAHSRELPEFLARAEKYYEAMDYATQRAIPSHLAGPAIGEWRARLWAEAVRALKA
ncbi:MAG: hypothetical protein LBQ36_03370 [Synergistaceae bacterium]|nr:hypothetical protein [Synergistaceae bacterium]